ncbi:MAG: hypothetical protein WCZ66_05225 [Sphingomonadaceae bacterium]
MTRHIEHFEAIWNGIQISISWEPRWLNPSDDYGLDTAHLQIEAVVPERTMLPITGTGYRSHFTTSAAVAAMGGPVACVLTWLNQEAAKPARQQHIAKSRQLALF